MYIWISLGLFILFILYYGGDLGKASAQYGRVRFNYSLLVLGLVLVILIGLLVFSFPFAKKKNEKDEGRRNQTYMILLIMIGIFGLLMFVQLKYFKSRIKNSNKWASRYGALGLFGNVIRSTKK